MNIFGMILLVIIMMGGVFLFRKTVIQVLMDTLMKNGKYSRKSLQMFASFIICTVMGFIIIYRNQVNDSAIQVFYGFLAMAGGMAVLTVWDKIKGTINSKKDEN